MFKYVNLNPLNRHVDDCVIRAISMATNSDYEYVYMKLSQLALDYGTMVDDVNFVEGFLDSRYNKLCFNKNSLKIDLNDFCDMYSEGVYIVTMQGHITCVKDGDFYDIWDCGNKKIWCAWKVEE